MDNDLYRALFEGTCPPEKLMDDAVISTKFYFLQMRRRIDEEFGERYAQANPQLLGAAVLTCGIEFATGYLGQKLDTLAGSFEQCHPNNSPCDEPTTRGRKR